MSSQTLTELTASAHRSLWMPYQPANGLVAGEEIPIIESASGCWMTDIDGMNYLDALGALEASAVGHVHPRMIGAITRQLEKVEFVDTFRYTTPATVSLAAKIAELTPGSLARTHFSAGGSEAVEAAIKMALQYHVLGGDTRRTKVISRFGAYHGCTYGAMAVDGHFYATRNFVYEPLPPLGRFVNPPYPYRCTLCDNACTLQCADEIELLIRRERPETIAAVIVDPASTAIAVSIPPDGYLARVRDICDRYGILLVADEVITGFARTGRMFASEHWGLEPDIMTMSKGLSSGYVPIAATTVTEDVAERFSEWPSGTFWHGHTFGGHPVACAAALESIAIIEDEGLAERADLMGKRLLSGLWDLYESHPVIGDVRGLGLLCGVELVLDRASRRLSEPPTALGLAARRACRRNGLVLASLEPGSTLLISPPLVISETEVDELLARLDAALAEVELEWGITR
jgi:putrescine aminotransferase